MSMRLEIQVTLPITKRIEKNETKGPIICKCYPDFSCDMKYSLLKIKVNIFYG